MKRKIYKTQRERMTDQIIGFLAFPIVNVPLWILRWVILLWVYTPLLAILVTALPWLVNGLVLVLAFLLRPQFAIGYLSFIAVGLTVVTALSVVFVAACFVTFVTLWAFPTIGDQVVWVLIVTMAVGLVVLGGIAIYIVIHVFQRWRSS
jgi:hypothetical protein